MAPSLTPQRFILLDAIRGLAAVFVLLRHTVAYWQFGFYRSYLAVDLFFVLSGFVIAFAYDEKMRTKAMGLGQFLAARLIRMYPMYLFSLVLCALVWFDQLPGLVVPFALALFFLPCPVSNSPAFFGLNGPYWSLFFELVANLLYGLLRPLLTNRGLVALIGVFGLGVAAVAVVNGNLDTGWLWNPGSAFAGVARSVFGVFLGVLLFRYYPTVSAWVGRWMSPWVAFVLVAVVLASPDAGDFNPLVDVVVVFVVFPVLVVAASRYRGTRGRGLLLILGAASYPLYTVHQQVGGIVQFLTGGLVASTAPWSGLVFTVVLLGLCAGLEKVFDLPVRRWLKETVLGSGLSPSAPDTKAPR